MRIAIRAIAAQPEFPGTALKLLQAGAEEAFSAGGERYDIIMDTVGTVPFSRAKASLTRGGRLLVVLGGRADLLHAPWAPPIDRGHEQGKVVVTLDGE